MADRWEHKIHVITKQIGESPVYVVKPEIGVGPYRTLHRDLLLPCGFLPVQETNEPVSRAKATRKLRSRNQNPKDQSEYLDGPDSEASDSMDELYPVAPMPKFVTYGPFPLEGDHRQNPEVTSRAEVPTNDAQRFEPFSEVPDNETQAESQITTSGVDAVATPSRAQSTDHVVIEGSKAL